MADFSSTNDITATHTPTPWRVTDADCCTDGDDVKATILADSGRLICHIDRDYRAPAEANAAHIVRCVNAHDELIAALRYALDCAERGDVTDMQPVRDALARAKGE
jgi:hypothetical protein